jgi:hypothetical protein
MCSTLHGLALFNYSIKKRKKKKTVAFSEDPLNAE